MQKISDPGFCIYSCLSSNALLNFGCSRQVCDYCSHLRDPILFTYVHFQMMLYKDLCQRLFSGTEFET